MFDLELIGKSGRLTDLYPMLYRMEQRGWIRGAWETSSNGRERIIGRPVDFSIEATGILRDGIGWTVVPGLALLTGGFLVGFLFNRRSWSKEMAIG